MDLVPPILHFSKRETGRLRFNGLCVLDRLEHTWFEDHERPVRNYRAHLTILDQETVEIDWLHSRVTATSRSTLVGTGPSAWRRYQDGVIDRLRVWAPRIRSLSDQLPAVGTPDARLLGQLLHLAPTEFEVAVVSLFRKLETVQHDVTRTRPTADGGFDFVGSFTLPAPVRYEVPFRGEVKRYARGTAVGPKDVSRLVARLGRGEYGLFLTTSYFTRQAQEEVLEDRYPARLFSGADLVGMIRELRVNRGLDLSPTWLRSVADEFAEPLSIAKRAAESEAPYDV